MTDLAPYENDLLASFADLPGVASAVYRQRGGGRTPTVALVSDRAVMTDKMARGEYAAVRLPLRDVAEPVPGDTVEVDGEAWEIRARPGQPFVLRHSWPFWILSCRRETRPVPGGGR